MTQPHLCVSVAPYGGHSPLWEVLLYWSDEPRVDLKAKTFGSHEGAMRYAHRQANAAQLYRAPVKMFVSGRELV